MISRPAPLPHMPERDRAINRRAAVIIAAGALVFGLPLLFNLWPAVQAVADVIGLH